MAKNPRLIDHSGQRFGKWMVARQQGNTSRGGALWWCVCDCGTERAVLGADLRNKKSASCGCTTDPTRLGRRSLRHGGTGSRLYQSWKNMRGRCTNPQRRGYENYGARGITICDEWDDFQAFQDWALSNGYRHDLTLERVDVNGNYEPANCTWANSAVQSANRRFVNKAPDGELWWHKARANGITRAAYNWRLAQCWPMELVVSWPQGKKRHLPPRMANGKFSIRL
jgi:hypothetical protein